MQELSIEVEIMIETQRGLTKPFGCTKCSMNFETEELLDMHDIEKHPNRVEPKEGLIL